jgi:hypothetical protein
MPQPGQLSGVILLDFLPVFSFGEGASFVVQLVVIWAVMPTKMAPSNALGSFIEVRVEVWISVGATSSNKGCMHRGANR